MTHDAEQIKSRVLRNFLVPYGVKLDVDQEGRVHVRGPTHSTIKLINRKITQLPVEFGTVEGSFEVTQTALTTLKGSPSRVTGSFACGACQLDSLEGGPDWVGGWYDCHRNQLTNLEGCASHVGHTLDARHNPLTSLNGLPERVFQVMVTWSKSLPLLPLLSVPERRIDAPDQDPSDRSEPPWTVILDKYAGQGNKGVLKAAAELIKAGYRDNARL